MDLSIILAACLISLVGLPHGALDPVIAHRYGLFKNIAGAMSFFILYLGIAFTIILFWVLLPETALIGFLIVSAFHFGRDWRHKLRFGGFGYGAVVLGLPALLDPEATSLIFEFLLFQDSAKFSVTILQLLGLTGVALVFYDIRELSLLRILEVCLLGLVAALLSPLWYFVLYFCGFHSPRHLANEFQQIAKEKRLVAYIVILLMTIITLVIAAIFGAYFEKYYDNIDVLIYQLTFIGLAGLTVPHICLLEWAARKEHASREA